MITPEKIEEVKIEETVPITEKELKTKEEMSKEELPPKEEREKEKPHGIFEIINKVLLGDEEE